MREVAADDEEILVCEIRLQYIRQTLQFPEVVGRDDNRYDGRHLAKASLQERQLHFQTVLPVVGLRAIGKTAVGSNQPPGSLTIHLHLSQRCGVIVGLTIHRGPIQPLMMAGSQEEDTLESLSFGQRHIGLSRHIAREIVTSVGYYQGCRLVILLVIGVKRQKTVHLVAQPLGIAIVESSCLCGWPHHRLLLIEHIHHDDSYYYD